MSTPPAKDLPVLQLGSPRPPWRLTPSAARVWAEAAAVCLDAVGHEPRVEMAVSGVPRATRVVVQAPTVDDAMRNTHRERTRAAELGAQAVVASLIHDLTDQIFVEQAVHGTRIDYWLSDRDAPLFQRMARLEISGILEEKPGNTVAQRMAQKLNRLDQSTDERPAKVAVVEFSSPRTVMEDYVRRLRPL